MTSSNKLTIGDLKYTCHQIDYSTINSQYYALSYLDLNSLKYEKSLRYTVMGNNNLFDKGNFHGHLIRLNCYYNLFESKQILFQSSTNK